MMKNKLTIAVDFDGTCVTHEYPDTGKDIGAAPVLKELAEAGHRLILWTMRSGKELARAADWFTDNGIPLHGVNTNPTQCKWTQSPKAYANIYIDDAALGCPLVSNPALSDKPYVNWEAVGRMLEEILSGNKLIGHTALKENA